MLFAELHGKLSPDAADLERQEDTLTSTVFGTLVVAEAWPLLHRWLSCARDLEDNRLELPEVVDVRWWFWPRLAAAEPDVVLLFEDVLVVVEAKYLSGKSGGSGVNPESGSRDQLYRQWRSCDPSDEACNAYPPDLRDAVRRGGARRALVYLVRQPRSVKAEREIRESLARIRADGGSASIYSLGWGDLAAALASRSAPGGSAWRTALLRLLERRGFTAFRGFPGLLPSGTALFAAASRWQFHGARRSGGVSFLGALAGIDTDLVRRLAHSPSAVPASSANRRFSTEATIRERRWSGWISIQKLALIRRLAGKALRTTSPWQALVSPRHLDSLRRLAATTGRGVER